MVKNQKRSTPCHRPEVVYPPAAILNKAVRTQMNNVTKIHGQCNHSVNSAIKVINIDRAI